MSIVYEDGNWRDDSLPPPPRNWRPLVLWTMVAVSILGAALLFVLFMNGALADSPGGGCGGG